MDNQPTMRWRKPIERADPSLPQRLGLYGDNSGIPVEGAVIIKLLALPRELEAQGQLDRQKIEDLHKQIRRVEADNKFLSEEKELLAKENISFHTLTAFDDDAWWQATAIRIKIKGRK